MGTFQALLLQNGVYAGAALLLIILCLAVATPLFLRIADIFLSARIFANADRLKSELSRQVWRLAILGMLLSALGLAGGLLVASQRRLLLRNLVAVGWSRLEAQDLIALGLLALKAVAVLVLAFFTARLLAAVLKSLRQRLQQAELLGGQRERIATLLEQLRLALAAALWFAALSFCAELLHLPDTVQHGLLVIAYIGVGVYAGQFAVDAAHLAIDVLFELSEVFSLQENPLRYLGRFKHLSSLTKRTADYFIYVGIATWTVEQIKTGTWAAQSGRLALRIIAIFYLSRVLVEVCILFMNEFFLTGDNLGPAERQQRQTLVPVAASLLRYGIYFMAVTMMLRDAGMDPTALLAGAGVAGVAVGLGAQSFVGDLVAGFFILFENLFLVGDLIQVGDVKGRVEEIAVRVTKIRDEAGVLHSIPNGEVRKVSSHSKGYVNAVVDILIPYGEDLRKVFELFNTRSVALRQSHADIIGPTEIGIEELKESAVLVRTVTMVKPGTDKEMEDVLKLGFWEALTEARVAAPYARHVIVAPVQLAGQLLPIEQPRPILLPTPSAETTAQSPQRSATEPVGGVAKVPRTDIQKIKAHNLYLAFDVDENGYLEEADLSALGLRLVKGQRRGQDSPLYSELRRKLHAYWMEMVRSVDHDADGRVSKEEFLQFCEAIAKDLTAPAGKSVQALADVLFIVCDRNDTGTLSEGEFLQFVRACGLSDAAAIAGFNQIDSDHNGRITKAEWQRLFRDIFLSKKLNDAAAVVFGPGCRDQS